MENEQTAGDTPRQDRILDPALVGAGRRDREGWKEREKRGNSGASAASKAQHLARAMHINDILINVLMITKIH